MSTTIGRLLVNDQLPEELRTDTALTMDELNSILAKVAQQYPERYRDVSHALVQLGREAAYAEGATLRLSDTLLPIDRAPLLKHVRAQTRKIMSDPNLSKDEKAQAIEGVYSAVQNEFKKQTYQAALAKGNPFALQVKSKARGSPAQLMALMTTPGLYEDAEGKIIPMFIRRSYAEGLKPHEYWAATYGARKSVISTKFCLVKGTMVLTHPGCVEVPIEQLKPGDWVYALDSQDRLIPTQVTAVTDVGILPCKAYRFGTGIVGGTPEHKIQLERRSMLTGLTRKLEPLSRAKVGRRGAVLSAGMSDVGMASEGRALLLGALLGDGGLTTQQTKLYLSDARLVEAISAVASTYNLQLHVDERHPTVTTYSVQELERSSGIGGGHKTPFRAWLAGLGLLGKYAYEKTIPAVVYGWDSVSVGALVAGLWATDGCTTCVRNADGRVYTVVTFYCTSIALAHGLKQLLARKLGVYSTPVNMRKVAGDVSKFPGGRECVRNHDLYGFSINNVTSLHRLSAACPAVAEKIVRLKAALAVRTACRLPNMLAVYQDEVDIGLQPVHDIEVADPSHCFVLANGFVVSNSTRDAGYLGKQFGTASNALLVTEEDCETPHGIPVSASDVDSIGAVLVRDVGKYRAGTVITRPVLADLQKKTDTILVRSPITCGAKQGICKQCAGVRETGDFPELGYNIGVNASSALAERIAQSSLNVKHCISSLTLVLYADWSVRKIADVKIGDMIMGATALGKLLPVRVVNVFDNGPREVYRTSYIRNSAHRDNAVRFELESTLDHELLATRRVSGQKETALNFVPRMLKVGTVSKFFYAVTPKDFDDAGLATEPYALLLGQLLGDGCYTEAVNGVHLSSADTAQVDEMNLRLVPMGLKLQKLQGHDYYYRVSTISPDFADALGNPVRNWLEKHGMYGKYAYEKMLPAVVNTWNNASVAELIGGLFVTDGSVYNSDGAGKLGVALSSTSKQMLVQVQYLLQMRFGIQTSELTMTRAAGASIAHLGLGDRYVQKHDLWQFTITSDEGVRRFADKIPLIGAKNQKLQELVKTARVCRNNYTGLRRISQEFIGILPTHDLEVDHPDHLYVLANGLIVSNSGGVSSGKGEPVYAGFPVIEQMAQVPETFPDAAPLAALDGKVDEIREAPQGGSLIMVDGERHYVPADRKIYVKVGDRVEAGDQLASGLINPRDVVHYKGIGEGRRYFTERMLQVFKDSGLDASRRNMEVLSRSLINHVISNDVEGTDASMPGEIVAYNTVANRYRPRPEAELSDVLQSTGRYLEQPVLHHTIGTRITRSIADQLKRFGHTRVLTHPQPPSFEPYMLSLREIPQHERDWVAQLGSNYLRSGLLKNVHRSAESNVHGLNPIPAIAKGTEIGKVPKGQVGY